MWFHQRTGPNSGLSYSGGALLLGLLIVGTMIAKAWPVAVTLLVMWGAVVLAEHRTRRTLREGRPEPTHRFSRRFDPD